jgi:demethylmenaquinone methyltransferase/2-methoxy-6-polyprenyl-1,4-benzoquinol methylase
MPSIAAILRNPSAKREYNKQLFATVAPRYTAATCLLSLGRDAAWKAEFCGRLSPSAGAVVLDIATGTGDLALSVRKRCASAAIVACDLSAAMLSLAAGPCRAAGICLARQDMSLLGLKDGSVDMVTGGYALRNAPDLGRTLAELHRVLKPGGTAHFLEFTRSRHALLSAAQWRLMWLWGGLWGILLHGRPSIYAYLGRSLRLYPDRGALHDLLRRTGFSVVDSRLRMAGLIELLVVRKAAAPAPSC